VAQCFNIKLLPNKTDMKKLLLFFATMLISICSFSQTNTYSAASGAWTTAGNWSLAHVPLNTEDVAIPSTSTVSTGTGAVNFCKTLTVSGTLTFAGGSPRYISVGEMLLSILPQSSI